MFKMVIFKNSFSFKFQASEWNHSWAMIYAELLLKNTFGKYTVPTTQDSYGD